MRLTLSQQIALSLRNRPLVLPMLLATVCVDLLLARNVATPGSGVSSHMILNFCLLGQVGLLAFWSSCCAAWWWLRVLVSLAVILLFAVDPASTAIRWDSFATHSVYFAVVLGMRSLGSLIAYTRGENPQAIRFGVRHLLIAMTLLAVGSTMTRFVVPRDWSTTADDAAFVVTLLAVVTAMPFPLKAIVDRTRRFTRSNALALIYCALTGGATGLALAMAFMHGANNEWFIQALTLMSVGYGLWFIASSVPPDARRRLASRRHRRRAPMPMLRVVAPPDEPNEPIEPATDNTPRIGFDAKG